MKAVLLAGGKSLRMEQDKALLEFGDKLMIELIVQQLKFIFTETIIITNENLATKLQQIFLTMANVRVITDVIPDKGPMGGLYSAFQTIPDEDFFMCSCDAPYISKDLIEFMKDYIHDFDAVVPCYSDRLQPLFSLYSRKISGKVAQLVADDNLKMMNLINSIQMKVLTESEIEQFNWNKLLFKNINTKADYLHVKSAVIENLL